MLKRFNSYTVDIFINGPLIFLSTVVDISSNGDELNLTTLIFLWTRLDLSTSEVMLIPGHPLSVSNMTL